MYSAKKAFAQRSGQGVPQSEVPHGCWLNLKRLPLGGKGEHLPGRQRIVAFAH
jgi:hypothetical protein